jgi:hypothetical protein
MPCDDTLTIHLLEGAVLLLVAINIIVGWALGEATKELRRLNEPWDGKDRRKP